MVTKTLFVGHEQAQNSQSRGSIVRRQPVASIHPLVRTHPVGISTSEFLRVHADAIDRLLAKRRYLLTRSASYTWSLPIKSTNTNATVTRHIIGYKQEESDLLLKFLYNHIALGQDFQVRVKWAPRTVVVWDVSTLPCFLIADIELTQMTIESRHGSLCHT